MVASSSRVSGRIYDVMVGLVCQNQERGSAVGVVVTSSARETFTPHQLSAAYKDFTERGAQYLNAKTGFRVAAYRFEARMLIVYQESERDVVVLSLPTSGKGFPPEFALTL